MVYAYCLQNTNMGDSDRTKTELNLYCSPHSILVLGKAGRLMRLFCPFKVKPILKIDVLLLEQVYNVTAVRISDDLKIFYVIASTAYPYHFFIIL